MPAKITSMGVKNVETGNSKVTIDCFAMGSPKPEITWYRGTEPLTPKQNDFASKNSAFSSIMVDNYDSKHLQVYVCMAKNLAGVDIKKYQVVPQSNQTFCFSLKFK